VSRFPWAIALVLLVAWAKWHLAGLLIAGVALVVVGVSSARLNPWTSHGRCNGTGRHRSWLFPWAFRRCGRCTSGRVLRPSARLMGSGAARAEAARAAAAQANARSRGSWR
jgi:hypothetical protein